MYKNKAVVYILKDLNDRLYIVGSTIDLNRRLLQHSRGHTYTTKSRDCPKLVFSQEFPDINNAQRAEVFLKGLKRRDYLEKIISDGKIKKKI